MSTSNTTPSLELIDMSVGWRIDLPIEDQNVISYFAERLKTDSLGYVRLVRLTRSSRDYSVSYAGYRSYVSNTGKTPIPFWEKVMSNTPRESKSLELPWRITDMESPEFQAFLELLKQR